ncbi:hypothetical protein I316_06819 [Kwoniella heveanensis BCC8398]|uniref:Major facilitator superfamily (MFS) profile domain-containing protein n=1 Tax=Kwoniella heveanensis BCC8398 TaxID=1296120 RepID=A0A1B9GK93_9TREE|nr:hypothetical protein I316_06819 [Kwoniella heveanensis BCC8398]
MASTGSQKAAPVAPHTMGDDLYTVVNRTNTVVLDIPGRVDNKGTSQHVEDVGDDAKEEIAPYVVPPTERLGFVAAVKKYKYATFLCFLAGMSAWCDGYEQGMSGSIVALKGFVMQFGHQNDDGKWALEPNHVSLFAAMKNLAAVVGGSTMSYPVDRFGRKFAFLFMNVIMIAVVIAEMFAKTPAQWIGARILDGFAVGMATCFVNVYVAELAPTSCRGALMGFYAFFNNAGGFTGSVGLNVVQRLPPSQWRHIIYSQWVLIVLALAGAIWIPESPRWLVAKGKNDKARKVLKHVYGRVPDYDVDVELQRMVAEIEFARQQKSISSSGSYRDVFRGTNFRRFIISVLPYHFQAAVGTGIISIYSSYFFGMLGLANPFNATVATGVTQLVSGLLAIPLIERVGRRRLILVGGAACIVCLVCMGTMAKVNTDGTVVGLVVFACLWYFFFSSSISPLGYVYMSETATVSLRAKTSGLAIVVCQGFSFAYNYIIPICLNAPALGTGGTVLLFVATASFVWTAIFFLVPETKHRSFTELDELFERKIPAWRFASTETQEDRNRNAQAQNPGNVVGANILTA